MYSVYAPLHRESDSTDGVILLGLLLAALGSGLVDTASNQVKLLRPRMGKGNRSEAAKRREGEREGGS